MMEAILHCKRLLQALISTEETLSSKRTRGCAELEILLEDLAETLPTTEQTAIKEILQLYEQLWSSQQKASPEAWRQGS